MEVEEPHVSGDQTAGAAAPVTDDHSDHQMAEPSSEPRQVPLDALQAERAERQKLQDELKMMRDHLLLMQANQSQPRQQPKDDFDGLSEDDVLTVRDLKKALSKKEQQFQMTIQELQMTQRYPDYQQVVSKYLPEVFKQNPSLRDTLARTQDYELAYYLAKNSDSYKQAVKSEKKNADAERIVQNANKAGSLSSVGQTSPINQAKRYKEMSDAEFMQHVQKNLGYY